MYVCMYSFFLLQQSEASQPVQLRFQVRIEAWSRKFQKSQYPGIVAARAAANAFARKGRSIVTQFENMKGQVVVFIFFGVFCRISKQQICKICIDLFTYICKYL